MAIRPEDYGGVLTGTGSMWAPTVKLGDVIPGYQLGGDTGQWVPERTATQDDVNKSMALNPNFFGSQYQNVYNDWSNPNNFMYLGGDPNGTFQARLKTDDKQGTTYSFVPDGQGGYKIANTGQNQYWDTNQSIFEDPSFWIMASLATAGALSGAGVLGGVGSAGTAAGDIGGGLFVGEQAASPTLQTLLAGAAPAAGGAGGGWTLGQIANGAKNVISGVGAVNSVNNMINGPSGGGGGSSGSGGSNVSFNPTNSGGGGGIGTDLANIFSVLGPLAGTYFSNQQRNDLGDKLLELYKGEAARLQPWEQKLKESYDNPQAVFTSPEFTSGRDLYKSALDRKAADQGTLSNPIARQQLLDKYGANYMRDYRQGVNNTLADMVRNASNYKDLAVAGLVNQHSDAGAWAETFGKLFGNNKGSFDAQTLGNKLDTFMKSGGNIYDFFRNMGNINGTGSTADQLPNWEPGGSTVGFPSWGGGSDVSTSPSGDFTDFWQYQDPTNFTDFGDWLP